MNRNLIKSFWLTSALGSVLLIGGLLANNAAAFLGGGGAPVYTGPIPNSDFKAGFVLARSIVLDPDTGEPILVEFGSDGNEIAPVDIGEAKVLDLIVYPAADYRFHQQRRDAFIEQYKESIAQDAEVMTRNEFEQAQFLYADNKTQIAQDELDENVKSVLVRAQKNRFVPFEGVAQEANEILVLLEFDVDLTQQIEITPQHQSLVLNQDGQVTTASNNTIGYRVGFFGDPTSAEQAQGGHIQNDDTVYGPVPGARVYVDELVFPGSISNTANDGRYSFSFNMPPCPIGGFTYTTDVWAELRYKNFLPTGTPSIPYFLRTPGYSSCFAQLVPAAVAPAVIGIQATTAIPNIQSNLYVDVMFLTGRIVLKNSLGEDVPVGDTSYTTFEKPADYQTQQFYDFDGDGESDHVEQGRLLQCTSTDGENDTKSLFLPDSINAAPLSGADDEVEAGYACNEQDPNQRQDQGGNWQGVYFAGVPQSIEDEPDLVRVIDAEFRDREIGVLKTISKEDMRNTDVYLFRESTGQLILERRGLKEAEAKYRRAVDYDQEQNEVAYRIMLRGNRDYNLNLGGGVDRRQSFEEWATDYQLAEPLRQREADHPRPGEFIKVVAINRATGYTGTARVKLQGAAAEESAGMLDVETPVITLGPPNLKIWAERDYEVEQGLTKGEERSFQIGNEGAALTSDTTIKLYTEWLDEEGKPLPEELGLDNGEQYGLTGRFAKVVGTNQLKGDSVSSDLAEFAIAPGRNTQALRLKGQSNGTEHFYIHVIGKAKEQECVAGATCPSFDLPNNQAGLEGRPQLLTPFLTPLWDEDKHWQDFRAYRNRINELEEEFEDQEIPEDLEPAKPLPAYAWEYRPEYQFSQFEFELAELNRANQDAEGNETTTNIIDADTPTIASSDDYVEALYSLIDANFEPLNPIDGGQELILALGEQEQRVTFGEDQTIRFDDISSLGNLDVEDLLSLRLYSNNDAGNVLWEYAFEFLGMIVGTNPIIYDGEIFVDADEPELEVSVFLVGENRSDSSYRVRWSVIEGDAEISPSISVLEDGVADAILIVSPMVNNRVRIGAELIESEDTLATSEVIKVKAGLPVRAEMISQGDLHTGEVGEIDVLARIFDTHGNPVSDGTPVSFNSSGGHYVSSAEPATNDGVAKAKLKGSYRSGSFPLGVESGRAINEIPISVLPLTVNFESLPSSFIAGSTYSLTARLQTDSGIAGGAYAYIGAKGAVINQSSMISDAQGRISFRLSLPSDSQEEITLFAKSSLNDITRIEVPVLAEAVSMKPLMSFEKNYKSEESKSTSNTILEFQESQNLVFDDPHFPNKAPIYLSRFSNVRNDDNGAYSAEYNVFRNKESLYENFYSIEFKQRGSGEADFWALKDSDKLAKEHPHIAFWIKLESEGLILDAQNERLKIAYSNGSLSASIKSNAGIQNFNPINVDPDRWYKVAVGTTANSVFFAVGDIIERVSTDSASIDWNRSDKWLEFGKGFGGKLSGLRIYDSESVDLIEITPSGLEINDLDLDYNSTVAVSLDDQKVLMPILTAVNRDIYHSTLRRVFTDNSLLNEYFTIESVFPSAEQPMSSIFSSVNQEPSFGPLESLLVSTDWIGLRADFKEIKPYIQTLHDFYSRSGQSEIIAALSDELSRSLNEARAGNEMRLLSMRTGLLVLSELIHTRPQAGSIIGDAIQNRKDLWVWLRYLSMPGEGWAGPIIPIPKPENTCDIIDPVVNIGTFLSYNPIPCRVNGELVGDILLTWVDLDPEVATDKTVLTRYLEVMVSGLTGAPLELTKLVFADAGSDEQNRISSNLFIEDAHANPALLIARLMVFALKTGAKAGYSSAPANMVNFLKNNTNSRFSSAEILGAMAYLESRRPEGVFQCESCELIDKEVFGQIDKNYRAFFNGLSLAKDGDIVEGDVKRRVCMLANQAHGAALEIVGTAAYHALYEFGELDEYEILSADSYVGVPIREPGLLFDFTDVEKGDYRRVPDLILEGDGEKSRTWIEFKSWSKARGYVKRNELQGSRFDPWNMTKHKYQFQHGHRQHMLDYIASRGQIENIWNTAKFTDNNGEKIDNIDNLNNRAGDHRTWVQVWDSDKTRFYEPIVRNKKTDKWEISKNTIPINLHTPWIDSNGIIADSQVQLSDFKLLQEYLTQSPKNMGDKAFRMSIGYPKNQHRKNYVSKQVGKSGGTVAPFTLLNVLQQEAGEKVASEIYSKLSEQVAGSPFAEYLNGGDLSAEQIEKLRVQVEEQVLENFGFIGDALEAVNEVTPDWWLRLEESLQDSIAGMVGDDARDFLAGFEVPDAFKDYLCEVEGEGE